MSEIKVVRISKRPKKQKRKSKMASKKKGGKRLSMKYCDLDWTAKRKSGPNGGAKRRKMKGGSNGMCAGMPLHKCLEREIKKSNKKIKTSGTNKNYAVASKWPRFGIRKSAGRVDLLKKNRRSDVNRERLRNNNYWGGAKQVKTAITKPAYRRLSSATPQYAKKYTKPTGGKKRRRKMKGGQAGYRKAKSVPGKLTDIRSMPMKVKARKIKSPKKLNERLNKEVKEYKSKGGAAGYRKAKNRVQKLTSPMVRPKKVKYGKASKMNAAKSPDQMLKLVGGKKRKMKAGRPKKSKMKAGRPKKSKRKKN